MPTRWSTRSAGSKRASPSGSRPGSGVNETGRRVPRIRDLPSKRLYVFERAGVPKRLRPLVGGKVNVDLIDRNWADILRVAATMAAGTMRPSQLLRKLAAYPCSMIEWTTDPDVRRRALIGLNKGEAHHALKRAINFHQRGAGPNRGGAALPGRRPQPAGRDHHPLEHVEARGRLREGASSVRSNPELGLRPIYHRSTTTSRGGPTATCSSPSSPISSSRSSGPDLRAHGNSASWTTLRCILDGQQRVTATFRRPDGRTLHVRTLHVRTATQAEPGHRDLYDALGID